MSYTCTECSINWPPYLTIKGACPVCGSGTRRTIEPPDADARERRREADRRRERERAQIERETDFERYYADREAQSLRAAIDAFEHGQAA